MNGLSSSHEEPTIDQTDKPMLLALSLIALALPFLIGLYVAIQPHERWSSAGASTVLADGTGA